MHHYFIVLVFITIPLCACDNISQSQKTINRIEECEEIAALHKLVDKVCMIKKPQPISQLTQELTHHINAGASIDTKKEGVDYSQVLADYFHHGKIPAFIYDGLTITQQMKVWMKVHDDADAKIFFDNFVQAAQNRRNHIKNAVRVFLLPGLADIVFEYYEIEKFNQTDEEIVALEKSVTEKALKLHKLTTRLN